MRSMCRILIKKKRLQCTTKTVNLCVRLMQIVLEQVPCRWSSDIKGVTSWDRGSSSTVDGGWQNEGAVVQQLEQLVCTAQTDNRCLATVIPSLYVTRFATSSKCSSEWSRCVKLRSYFFVLLTTRATALMTHCNLSVTDFGAPANSRLQ